MELLLTHVIAGQQPEFDRVKDRSSRRREHTNLHIRDSDILPIELCSGKQRRRVV